MNLNMEYPISEEMEEVLYNDPEGSAIFHKLTPGAKKKTNSYS